MISLVLGGNKSGKSDYALKLFYGGNGKKCFIATGKAFDMDFRKQILKHREERRTGIHVLESGTDLHQVLVKAREDFDQILVDSLDFWLFSCLYSGCVEEKRGEVIRLVSEWDKGPDIIFVSCEVGLGPIAPTREVRQFVRELGGLNQEVAALADEVYLVAAGLPLTLKK
jgi:adenosylcobinamide kinase/adenosylcobinamide-phosphate guanylyltransferase